MSKERLEGIGGWLILYIISSFYGLVIFLDSFTSIGDQTSTFSMFHIIDILNLILIIVSLTLIFFKSTKAPRWNKIRLWFNIIFIGVALAYSYLTGLVDIYEAIISFVPFSLVNLAWIAYWTKSKRVKNTFRNKPLQNTKV